MTTWTKEPMTDLSQPWIVCAAIKRRGDGELLVGPRHFDAVMQSQIRGRNPDSDELDRSWADGEQGFIDQHGKFWSRKQAAIIAADNGQVKRSTGAAHLLYSEDLY